jgi:hypothetical protein
MRACRAALTTSFPQSFASWSDIAGQTVSALLSRPKAGEGTVRALLTAAADAVAAYQAAATSSRVGAATAVRWLLAELDDRDRAMLSARLWAPRAESQRTLADRLGLNIAWIQRNQPRAQARHVPPARSSRWDFHTASLRSIW